jgi:hypothetical protein
MEKGAIVFKKLYTYQISFYFLFFFIHQTRKARGLTRLPTIKTSPRMVPN